MAQEKKEKNSHMKEEEDKPAPEEALNLRPIVESIRSLQVIHGIFHQNN
jgi:hypothetical protein